MATNQRLLQIIKVLRRYSFISNFYHQTNPDQVRQALEALGPAFIKLGQILSTRPDLVSPAYIQELQQLQDDAPVDDYDTIAAMYEAETGQTITEAFATFEKTPFASASIGQCHRATLPNGEAVVVKFQHPAVAELVEVDLKLFKRAVKLIAKVPSEATKVVDLPEVFDELARSLRSEIDGEHEAANGQRFYELNQGRGVFVVPKVYPAESSSRILVNEAMAGQSIKTLFDNHDPALNQQVGQAIIENFLQQVFDDHFFHADPHPGNLLYREATAAELQQTQVTKEQQHQVGRVTVAYQQADPLPPFRLVYLDFGMMGEISPELADGIAQIVVSLVQKDPYTVSRAVLAVCNRTGEVDESQFTRQLAQFIEPYLERDLAQIDLTTMMFEIMQLCQTNHLQMKPEVTMLMKAFGTLEGTVAKLDPSVSMLAVAKPFALRYLKQHLDLKTMATEQLFNVVQTYQAMTTFPKRVSHFLDGLLNGEQRLKLELSDQQKILHSLHKMVNLLATSLILAAVIMGSSIMVAASHEHPAIYHFAVFAYGTSLVVILGMLILGAWRRWRKK